MENQAVVPVYSKKISFAFAAERIYNSLYRTQP